MTLTHTIIMSWQRGTESVSKTINIGADGEDNRDITLTEGATNIEVDIAFAIARLELVFIVSDKDVTLKTNNSGTPVDTIALKANRPVIWVSDGSMDNPFSADVTKMYMTNGGVGSAAVTLRVVKDPTP